MIKLGEPGMKNKKKEKDIKVSKVIFTVVGLCLIILFVIFISGWVKKITTIDKEDLGSVLGEKFSVESNLRGTPVVEEYIKKAFQDTLNNTKETVSGKASEIEKEVIKVIEKEISSLSTSQIDALKVHICEDLGVITPEPSQKP